MRISSRKGECPECEDDSFSPSRAHGIEILFKALLPFSPLRCTVCNTRFWSITSVKKYLGNIFYICVFLSLFAILFSQKMFDDLTRSELRDSQLSLSDNKTEIGSAIGSAIELEKELEQERKQGVQGVNVTGSTSTQPKEIESAKQDAADSARVKINSVIEEPVVAMEEIEEFPATAELPQSVISNSGTAAVETSVAEVAVVEASQNAATVDLDAVNVDQQSRQTQQLQKAQELQSPQESPKESQQQTNKQLRAVVLSQVENWRSAWENQDVARYLASYSFLFTPEKEQSYAVWQKNRHATLLRPTWIKLAMSDVNVDFSDNNKRVTVRFKQDYSASNFADVSHKELTLVLQGGNWNIIRERTL